jgi:F-type H+-transporting ATPase subunit c
MTRKLNHWVVSVGILMLGMPAFAEEALSGGGFSTGYGMVALAAALAICFAAFGGALAQGRAVASALEGIARNPSAEGKVFRPLILGLALIESLVIYALLISFFIVFKL